MAEPPPPNENRERERLDRSADLDSVLAGRACGYRRYCRMGRGGLIGLEFSRAGHPASLQAGRS